MFFAVCFLACTIGAVCGVGGGVLIKPVLDALGPLGVVEVSFLSGCTVLAMSCYSVCAAAVKRESSVNFKLSTPLAIGGALGGALGKHIFSITKSAFINMDTVGAVQSVCLLILTAATLLYTLFKEQINSKNIKNPFICLTIGLILGILSSFLGIGGGPFNLAVLFFFFSMSTKTAAQNSLYIILISQASGLLQTAISANVPPVDLFLCVVMVLAGIAGGITGRALQKKCSEKTTTKLFLSLMTLIIFINIFNVIKFL